MAKHVPISSVPGLKLLPTEKEGIVRVQVEDCGTKEALSWDRFIRLKAAAEAIVELLPDSARVLDVGGFDGALALFLPGYDLDMLDPSTTGACFLNEPAEDKSYDLLVAVDVLEHVEPGQRDRFLSELARVSRKHIILNYPGKHTDLAQAIVFKATANALVKEHVEWTLPDNEWVLEEMAALGFAGKARSHGSLAVWLGQYIAQNLAPSVSAELNRYLVDNHSDEPFSTGLYELLIFSNCKSS